MKMKNLFILLSVVGTFRSAFSQRELTVTDKDVVQISEREEQLGVEYSYYMKDSNASANDPNFYMRANYNFYSEWIIFYDKLKKDTASYSKVRGDTCEIIQKWENKKLKAKEIYVRGNIKYLEYYCKNGQLVSKGDAFVISNDTMYYCNGSYRITYDKATGVQTYWSEDGKISMSGKSFKQISEGLWKKYDENGNVIWYLYYQYGKEIYSGKDYPSWLKDK